VFTKCCCRGWQAVVGGFEARGSRSFERGLAARTAVGPAAAAAGSASRARCCSRSIGTAADKDPETTKRKIRAKSSGRRRSAVSRE
jgi:hypothetical protein